MKCLAVTSRALYIGVAKKTNSGQNGSLVWKNNTPEKAVVLLGSINKELIAIINTKLCVDATGAILGIGKTKKRAPY